MKRLLFVVLAAGVSTAAAAAEGEWDAVAKAIGRPGTEMPGGVYRVGIPRSDLTVLVDGVQLRPALALGSYLAFHKAGKEAMVMGDLVLLQEEVNPVLNVLRDNGIDVTALHSHMLDEQPRLFFMLFWANDDAQKLADGLKAALDKTKRAK